MSCGDCYLSFQDEDALAEHQQSQHVEHVEQIFFQEEMKPDMGIIVKVCLDYIRMCLFQCKIPLLLRNYISILFLNVIFQIKNVDLHLILNVS